MAKMTKKEAKQRSTVTETLTLTGEEGEHIASLTSEKDVNAFLDALIAYRARVMEKVFKPAHKGRPERERATIEKMFHKILREAGEVGAATYVRLFFPQNETFLTEVAECLIENDSPKAARKAIYATKAWKREVKKTQKMVQYPLHK
jgi:hypothetical protein